MNPCKYLAFPMMCIETKPDMISGLELLLSFWVILFITSNTTVDFVYLGKEFYLYVYANSKYYFTSFCIWFIDFCIRLSVRCVLVFWKISRFIKLIKLFFSLYYGEHHDLIKKMKSNVVGYIQHDNIYAVTLKRKKMTTVDQANSGKILISAMDDDMNNITEEVKLLLGHKYSQEVTPEMFDSDFLYVTWKNNTGECNTQRIEPTEHI
jgi:hypothetical protein